jgi:hypothetical protein
MGRIQAYERRIAAILPHGRTSNGRRSAGAVTAKELCVVNRRFQFGSLPIGRLLRAPAWTFAVFSVVRGPDGSQRRQYGCNNRNSNSIRRWYRRYFCHRRGGASASSGIQPTGKRQLLCHRRSHESDDQATLLAQHDEASRPKGATVSRAERDTCNGQAVALARWFDLLTVTRWPPRRGRRLK